MTLIDSDVLIWILRGKLEVKSVFDKLVIDSKGLIFITPIQIAEIYSGMRETERSFTTIFLDSFEVIAISKEIGEIAGHYVHQYKKSHDLMMADSLIAATAAVHGFSLWTLNKKHYPMLTEKDFYI